jgi:hypothetical protein
MLNVVRLAETGPGEPVRFECGSPSFAACPMKPDNRPPKAKRRQSYSRQKVKIRQAVALKSQQRVLTGAMLSLSDWKRPLPLSLGMDAPNRQPCRCRVRDRGHGKVWGRRQSR